MILKSVGQGVLLGLGVAIPIGPVNVEIARRSLRGGYLSGLALGCGAATIDVCYALICCLSLQSALNHPNVLRFMGIAGGILLAFLGINNLRSAFAKHLAEMDVARPAGAHTHYLTGLLMTSLSPMTLLYWFVGVPGVVGQITDNPRRDLPFVCLGVFIGTFSWLIFFTGLMSWLGRWKTDRWLRVADAVGGLVLLGFAGMAFLHVARG